MPRSRRLVPTTRSSARRSSPSRASVRVNVPKVGWIIARSLALHFRTADALAEATLEEPQEVEGIGPERADLIAEWFSDPDNRTLLVELRDLGLQLELAAEERPAEGRLTGSQYVITGTLEGWTREEGRRRSRRSARRSRTPSRRRRAASSWGRVRARKRRRPRSSAYPSLSEDDLRNPPAPRFGDLRSRNARAPARTGP